MKRTVSPQATEIQRRFFQALDYAIESKLILGLRGWCIDHNLNRVKYANIRSEMNKPIEERKETNYKTIDLDALAYVCTDFGVSSDWLLHGKGKMLK